MKINISKNDGELLVGLEGRLDTVTAPDLESAIASSVIGATSLTIDCGKLEYISSAGLRVLLSSHKRMKGNMQLVNVSELVLEVFEMTGFIDILNIK